MPSAPNSLATLPLVVYAALFIPFSSFPLLFFFIFTLFLHTIKLTAHTTSHFLPYWPASATVLCILPLALDCSCHLVCCCSCPLQFQMAHLVPLKPYAAPVPRSQSLCDQPTKTMSAFPTQDPSLTPTPRPIHSRELVRQNSDPTSETPGPQAHQIREDRGPWIRLPDVELPPKVKCISGFDSAVGI